MKLRFLFALGGSLLATGALAQAPNPVPEAPAAAASAPTGQTSPDSAASPTTQADAAALVAQSEAAMMPAAPTTPAEGGDLSALELEALGLGADTPAVDTSLHFSGFTDFTVAVPIKPEGTAASGLGGGSGKYPTFMVGNVNLYLSKNLSESFRTMMEVRFSYLPNGTVNLADLQMAKFAYVSTSVSDYANSGVLEKWGGIVLQRIYLEYNLHSLLTIRAGQFLTPYGIWNVDHGSPTYIPVNRPYVVNNDWIPQRQTGFELFGHADLGSHAALGYHLTLSNGTGPITEYRDLDRNKAIGGRLYVEHRGAGYFRLGASGYYGRDTASVPTISIGADGEIESGHHINQQYDALALAADIQYKYKGLLLQAEWISQQRRYTNGGRPEAVTFGEHGYAADAFSWATYGLVGYQLPWWGLMPYVMGQYDHELTLLGAADLEMWVLHLGLNFHPIDAVTIKAEWLRSTPIKNVSTEVYNALLFQAAWAF